MNFNQRFQWIKDIGISSTYSKLPVEITELISKAEAADLSSNKEQYDILCEKIQNKSRKLVPNLLSFNEWERICMKYSYKS